jgi:uncharacterized protein YbaR (Trm112 family)
MFIELVDSLRCVRLHEPIWLVASAFLMEERDIVSGELGCPTCGARYPIERGIADFRDGGAAPEPGPVGTDVGALSSSEEAMRAAALLDLTEPGGFVVLVGAWSAAAPDIVALVERMHVLGLNPIAGVESGGGVSLALASTQIPLRTGVARGIALDAAHATPTLLTSAAEALRPRGRLLAPARTPLPAGLTELARDERHWVAVKQAATGPVVQLRVFR